MRGAQRGARGGGRRARLAKHEARPEACGRRQQAPEVALHGQLVALRQHHHHAPAVGAPREARLRAARPRAFRCWACIGAPAVVCRAKPSLAKVQRPQARHAGPVLQRAARPKTSDRLRCDLRRGQAQVRSAQGGACARARRPQLAPAHARPRVHARACAPARARLPVRLTMVARPTCAGAHGDEAPAGRGRAPASGFSSEG